MEYRNNHLIKGILWSGIDKFGIVLFQLILELFLARLLLPKDYGVVGIILVFISVGVIFTEGGFSNALIHKQDRSEEDFSAVFYFNLFTAVLVYLIIYLSAPFVERFYDIENLALLLRVTSLSIIFSSTVLVHKVKLSIQMDFKTQAKISLSAVLVSGIISLLLAYYGYGVWALVIQVLLLNILNSVFMWFGYPWLPRWKFSFEALKGLFGFGSRVLASSLIQTVYFNSYPVAIGKILSTRDLGIYSKANQFTLMPSSVLTTVLQRVLFPFFSSYQNDDERIFRTNQEYTKICCLLFFPIFFTLAAVSYPLIIVLFSKTWVEMVSLFSLFCVSFSLYPIIVNNMMMFQVKNKIKLFLNLEIITKIIGLTILLLTVRKGLIFIGVGILIQMTLQLLITTIVLQRLLRQGLLSQLKVIAPLLSVSIIIFFLTKTLLNVLLLNVYYQLIVGLFACMVLFSTFYILFYRKEIILLYNKVKNPVN